MCSIHPSEYETCDQRLLAIEAADDCPFCGTPAEFADPDDLSSDWGCPNCKAFVDIMEGWVKVWRLSPAVS